MNFCLGQHLASVFSGACGSYMHCIKQSESQVLSEAKMIHYLVFHSDFKGVK